MRLGWRHQWRTLATYLLCLVGGAILYHLVTVSLESQYSTSHREHETRAILAGAEEAVTLNFEHDKEPERKEAVAVLEVEEETFNVSPTFHFPQPQYSKHDSVLLGQPWVRNLKKYLEGVQGKQLSVVTSTEEHTDVLINWLISAYLISTPPLDNVLVLSMGKLLHDTLVSRGFSSLYVPASMIISPRANITRVFSQVHIVRLTVVRIINHFGYDVVNYDCDAIVLKNPQRLFDARKDVDLMGTFGKGPYFLFGKWGVTLNTGVMLLRANQNIEFFWERMASFRTPTTDDQNNINRILDDLGITWVDFKSPENIETRKQDILGLVRLTKPKFTMFVHLISFEKICRHTCTPERREDYYVWHALAIGKNRTVENKMSQARLGGAWFLSENWQEISQSQPTVKLDHWLKAVMDKTICSWSRVCD